MIYSANETKVQNYLLSLNVRETTKKNYYNQFVALETIVDKDFDEVKLSDLKFNNTSYKPSYVFDMLKRLKSITDLDLNRLMIQYKKKTDECTKERTETQISSVSFEQLNSLELEGVHYLLWYLLLKFGVRNMDLIIHNGYSEEGNCIYFKGKTLYYLRRDYKTANQYGDKEFKIMDKKFKSIVSEHKNDYIFINSDNEPFNRVTIGAYIKNTFNKYITDSNLTESSIYKIVVNKYKKNKAKLDSYLSRRGHNANVQEHYYK